MFGIHIDLLVHQQQIVALRQKLDLRVEEAALPAPPTQPDPISSSLPNSTSSSSSHNASAASVSPPENVFIIEDCRQPSAPFELDLGLSPGHDLGLTPIDDLFELPQAVSNSPFDVPADFRPDNLSPGGLLGSPPDSLMLFDDLDAFRNIPTDSATERAPPRDLWEACARGRVPFVKHFLELYPKQNDNSADSPTGLDVHDRSALYYACAGGHDACVELLLEHNPTLRVDTEMLCYQKANEDIRKILDNHTTTPVQSGGESTQNECLNTYQELYKSETLSRESASILCESDTSLQSDDISHRSGSTSRGSGSISQRSGSISRKSGEQNNVRGDTDSNPDTLSCDEACSRSDCLNNEDDAQETDSSDCSQSDSSIEIESESLVLQHDWTIMRTLFDCHVTDSDCRDVCVS
eukprot:163450_1